MKKRIVIVSCLAVFITMSIIFSEKNAGVVMAHQNEKTEESEKKGLVGTIIEGIIDAITGQNNEVPSVNEIPSTQPTVEVTVEPESTVTSEPTAEVTVEPESTVTPEPTVEETVTPESTVEVTEIPESTVEAETQEPMVGVTVAPEVTEEPTIIPDPTEEATVTPESTVVPIVTPEPTVTPTPEPEKKNISYLDVMMQGSSFYYTGYEINPSVTIRDWAGDMYYQGLDYEIIYFANKDVGTANAYVYGIGDRLEGSVYLSFNIVSLSLSNFNSSLSTTSYSYNGNSRKPSVYVIDNWGRYLTQNVDYVVKYSNNIVPGTAKATVTGIGNYSGSLSKTYKITLSKASGLKLAGRGTNSVKISWKKISGVTGYLVQRYNSSKKAYVNIKNITTDRTVTYTNSSLSTASTYKYRIRPYVVYNGIYYYGGYSSVLSATTKPATTKITLSRGKKYATIKWNKVSRVSGYEVYMANPGKTYKKIATVSSKKNSYKKTKLTSGKYYYFIVRSYVVKDGVKIYSSYSPQKYVKIK